MDEFVGVRFYAETLEEKQDAIDSFVRTSELGIGHSLLPLCVTLPCYPPAWINKREHFPLVDTRCRCGRHWVVKYEKMKHRAINPAGLKIIKDFEGLRLEPNQDPVGNWQIGWGHRIKDGTHPKISIEQAEQILQNDVRVAEVAVDRFVREPLTDNQFAALVSLVFNIGINAFFQSALLEKLNKGDYQGAADESLRWVYAKGKRLPGLERRRKAERELFLNNR